MAVVVEQGEHRIGVGAGHDGPVPRIARSISSPSGHVDDDEVGGQPEVVDLHGDEVGGFGPAFVAGGETHDLVGPLVDGQAEV
ncbi:MAG: hypothetical protein R2726_04700 [Acidimicrobiales bacterium]